MHLIVLDKRCDPHEFWRDSKISATGSAADTNDYLLYNATSDVLFYDADGSGQGVAVQFGSLTTKPAVTANDFLIVA